MKSIYLRNFFATAALVFASFLLISLAFVFITRSYIISEYRDDMQAGADEIARVSAAVAKDNSLESWELGMVLSSLSNSTGNHIFITDTDGEIVSCSDKAPVCRHIGMVISPATVAEIRAAGSYDQISSLDGMYENSRYVVAVPIRSTAEAVIGYVFVTTAIDNMLGTWSSFFSFVAIIAMAVFIIAVMLSFVFSKKMSEPLDEIAAASRKFARGDFSVRVKQVEEPTEEMGALIESFNKMADSLESSEKRRSEFIANISHELRTPMTTIAGFADGILDGAIPAAEQEKYLRSIRDETRRLSRLVRNMLDVSQVNAEMSDPTRRKPFDLTELMLQTLLSFESRAGAKNLDVDPQIPDDHIMVTADKDAITQVIYNLLDNAVKFSSPGSCIELKLYKQDGKAYVSVKDYGETIPPDDLPFIFDRFHKSDRSRSLDKDGVGLGLYLVKAIINSHDEDIAVTSHDGMTEFVFTLPLTK